MAAGGIVQKVGIKAYAPPVNNSELYFGLGSAVQPTSARILLPNSSSPVSERLPVIRRVRSICTLATN